METIKEVLMKRDNMTEEEADDLISQAAEDLHERLTEGEMPHDICNEWFGLEPDYIFELMEM
jgi:AmiR/NasT family two-component response regulator